MKHLTSILLGAALTLGTITLPTFAAEYKQETKVKVKRKVKPNGKVKSKTKVHHGRVKYKEKIK